jgi:hypothetical protein
MMGIRNESIGSSNASVYSVESGLAASEGTHGSQEQDENIPHGQTPWGDTHQSVSDFLHGAGGILDQYHSPSETSDSGSGKFTVNDYARSDNAGESKLFNRAKRMNRGESVSGSEYSFGSKSS